MLRQLVLKYQPDHPDGFLLLEHIVHCQINRERGEHYDAGGRLASPSAPPRPRNLG